MVWRVEQVAGSASLSSVSTCCIRVKLTFDVDLDLWERWHGSVDEKAMIIANKCQLMSCVNYIIHLSSNHCTIAKAARSFHYAYPTYVGHLPLAEKRFKEEMETNGELRLFPEVLVHHVDEGSLLTCYVFNRNVWGIGEISLSRCEAYLQHRPSEHLQKSPLAPHIE